jgi:RNA polymerase sigma-70 factor (ECF subfamily)
MTASPFDIELDEITLARARRGDRDACGRIFRDFHQPAWSVAMRLCQCRETAHEITQEAFITAFARISQFRGEAPFWGWMRRVVINHALSTMRRAANATHVAFEEHHVADTGRQHEQTGVSMDLECALAALEDDDRAVVWLHDVEGFNQSEIAQMYGMSESFSKTRLSRARAKLREWVDSAHPRAAPHEATKKQSI